MMEQLTAVCLSITDPVLGWLLRIPSDLAIVIVALATSLILRGVRAFTTDQDLLRRAADDKQHLKERMRAARRAGDREAVARFRNIGTQVALRTMGQEWKPLLVSILPVALLATWCFTRLEFHPPRAGEPVAVALYAPVSAIGDAVHIVPQDGLDADGWVREIRADRPVGTNSPPANGVAVWTLRGAASVNPYLLQFRCGDRTILSELRVGGTTYAPSLQVHGDGWVSEARMRPVRFLNIVPGIPLIGFAPWLVAYLIVVCAAFPVIRRITGIQ